MTTIHAEMQKTRRFPKKRHSVYKKGVGWLLEPNAIISGLKVSDDNRTVDIDICIPGVTKNQVEICGHKPCIKKSSTMIPTHEELIHVVLPK